MHMLATIAALLATILAVPWLAVRLDTSLTETQWHLATTSAGAMAALALACFVVSELSGNYSQVDKTWSIAPPLYAAYYAHASRYQPRVVLLAVLIGMWGVRLTANFARRGGYSFPRFWQGDEDYRWAVLRRQPLFAGHGAWRWRLFNLGFISLYQHGLVWLLTTPAIVCVRGDAPPLGPVDIMLALAVLAALAVETIADNQQNVFQLAKAQLRRTGLALPEPYDVGFARLGLWRLCRHPNYAAEQAVWLLVYAMGVAGSGLPVNASLPAPLLLVLLFRGSSDFSEGILRAKYPAYADYAAATPRFIPRLAAL